jgi:hypothetical protein
MFIGSSIEALPVVTMIASAFSQHAECVPWNVAPEFSTKGSFPTFTALCDAALRYDFSLFVLTPDDLITYRGNNFRAPRDNVLFEMGLFIGAIGPERVFAIVQQMDKPKMKIPSDLLGVNMPRFRHIRNNSRASLASIQAEICGFVTTVQNVSFRHMALHLANGWGFETPGRHFEVQLGAAKLSAAKSIIDKRNIAIAARIYDPVVNFEDDQKVVYSAARALPHLISDMVFQIGASQFGRTIRKGMRIQGRVVLVPLQTQLTHFATLKEAAQCGCRIVESLSALVEKTQ